MCTDQRRRKTRRQQLLCTRRSTTLQELLATGNQVGFTDSCSRAVVRRTLVRGQLFARPFFAGNVVRGVSCSPDSYAHGQLSAHQSISTGRRVRDSDLLPASVEAAKVVWDARERAMTSQDSGHQIAAQSSVGTSAAVAAKLSQASSWKRSLRRVKACPHCRRKVRQSPNFAAVSLLSATVALFCDSVGFRQTAELGLPTRQSRSEVQIPSETVVWADGEEFLIGS